MTRIGRIHADFYWNTDDTDWTDKHLNTDDTDWTDKYLNTDDTDWTDLCGFLLEHG